MKDTKSKRVAGKSMVTVVRTKIDRVLSDSSEEETILVRKFDTEPAYVSVKLGVTKNMGNYEFLRIDVGVSMPCYSEEVTEVEGQVAEWVDSRLDAKLLELSNTGKVV